MLQDTGAALDLSYAPQKAAAGDKVLCYSGRAVAVACREPLSFPDAAQFPGDTLRYLFSVGGVRYYLREDLTGDMPEGLETLELRALRTAMPQDRAFAAVTGQHLRYWYDANRLCGRCGAVMRDSETERALCCPKCGQTVYPTIAPAVIIAVTRGARLLVSHYAGRPYKGMALLAGYCEIGETLEDTVKREVMEEVGLRVDDITYAGSQPWGFDHDLLMGFYCRALSDDIRVDRRELKDAYWLERTQLSEPADTASLTNTLISRFRAGRDPYSLSGGLRVRHARPAELPRIMDIYAGARRFMADHGNPRQWGPTCWPPEKLIEKDIERGKCYVCVSEDGIEGVFYYDYGKDIEAGYLTIENGSWAGDAWYGVVHRIASAGRRSGVGAQILRWAMLEAGHLRIDTHPDNSVMQALLTRLGFERRGIIHVTEDNDPRYAYEIIG